MMGQPRSDGLLRGSREERVEAMLSLKEADWNLETVFDLHCGFLDHTEDVRLAALEALKEIAKRSPEPITLTPVNFLTRFISAFTAASGAARDSFQFLVALGTPEAVRAASEALVHVSRNEDFKSFVEILIRFNKRDLLEDIQKAGLSKTKASILKEALQRQS